MRETFTYGTVCGGRLGNRRSYPEVNPSILIPPHLVASALLNVLLTYKRSFFILTLSKKEYLSINVGYELSRINAEEYFKTSKVF